MTNLLARILLAMMLLPLALVVYLLVAFITLGFSDELEVSLLAATLVTALFVAVYWLRLWRDTVNWTNNRRVLTIGSGAACILLGILAAALWNTLTEIDELSFAIFMAGVVAMLSWLPITVMIWKETPSERAERLSRSAFGVLFCPRCGYNMTGLREARCPECGAQFTLNQLYAAQQKHEIDDAAAPREESEPHQTAANS
ncbi:MAG TPA: zinc ribbon domain-containing protein [Phycisphaerae bacterium]|jgi:hypothetical protein|nr:zinc ribbon domain-containing protein [Phycisphaerae bacterium]HOB75016.1 zinc ribbon domain-containing protein [Phycisphaerae bacterium]HOJ54849.1 zinc ribbon domain-containing protein [Phycisphaerae bacterium]HOL26873.1 zinc ribbon domain-containing protein [Phycisphaerae bacterium]HPP20828.1 zinc ribbon domain-containing protein [Phycisphaerae bacterium]